MARSEIPITVQATDGTVSTASVTISVRGGGTATIFAQAMGSGTLANPTVADSSGRIEGWLNEGSYTVTFGAPLSYSRSFDIVSGFGVSNIANDAVTTAKIANSAVTTAKVADSAVTTAKLADASVTEPKLAANAVSGAVLAANAITQAKLANNAVSSRTIATGAVGSSELAPNAVTTDKLANDAATNAKFASSSVDNTKLANSGITNAQYFADGAITEAKFLTVEAIKVANDVFPVGSIIAYAGVDSNFATNVWKVCNGSTFNPNTWPELAAAWGGTARYGSVAPLWRLPDLQGRMAMGANTTIGQSEGQSSGNRGPNHAHLGFTQVVVSGGSHSHSYSRAIDVDKGSYVIPGSFAGDRLFNGLTSSATNAADGYALHTHTVTGTLAETAMPANVSAYSTVFYLIKVARV